MKLGKSRRKQLLVRIRMNTALKPNDYWSLLRPILVAGLTYIGQPSDQYRFTSLPPESTSAPPPLPYPIYGTSPTELLRRGCIISPPDKGADSCPFS